MISNYILIVDDDPNIREGITREVEKEFENKAVVLNCKNGLVAANLLKCNTVDIVVTDIKMPYMNGIELLEFIRENNISCKSVVLSSYDDFNLVRDAMRAGASDYLLKPVDFPALHHILYKLLTEVIMERSNAFGSNAPVNMQKLLESYLKEHVIRDADLLAFEEKNMLRQDSPCILGCVKMEYPSSERLFKLQEQIREDLYNCLNKNHIRYKTILSGEVASCFVFMVFVDGMPLPCLNALTHFKDILVDNELKICISEEHLILGEMFPAFCECISMFEQGYYDLPLTDVPVLYKDDDMESALVSITEALNLYDMKDTWRHLVHFFDMCNTVKPSVKKVHKLLNDMLYELLRKNARYIEPLSRLKFTEHDIFHQIETAPSLSILERELFESLNHLVETVIAGLPDKDDHIIEKAKRYIEDNYNDYITLDDIAAHVYLNKSYFSTFFKNKVGLTYREYLQNYRIQKAVELIRNSDRKVYEIAQAVGYNDSAHFIRAFKKVTGKNPGAFRS